MNNWKTISSLKYDIFNLNKSNSFRISIGDRFKQPIFMTFVNSIAVDGSVKGINPTIENVGFGNFILKVQAYTTELTYNSINQGGRNFYYWDIPKGVDYITFDGTFVWDNIPNRREICRFEIIDKDTDSVYYRDDLPPLTSGDIVLNLYIKDYYINSNLAEKNLKLKISILNNTPSTMYEPMFRMGYTKNILQTVDNCDATVLVLEGEGNVLENFN